MPASPSASGSCCCYQILQFKLIGSGRSAKVYQVLDEDTVPTGLVIKLYDRQKDDCDTEYAMLKELRHSNIIRCVGEPLNIRGRYYLILEMVEKGSLQDMLVTQGTISEDQIKSYMRQLLSAVEYIHREDIVHKDLRLPNILVDKEGILKLADFAASEKLKGRHATKGVIRSDHTAAPEASRPGGVYGKSADIYSVGCIMYQLFGGSLRPGETQEHELEFPPAVPEKARELIRKCMEKDPSLRPTATQLLQDKYWEDSWDEENWVSGSPGVIVFESSRSPSFIGEAEAGPPVIVQAGSTPTHGKHSDSCCISRARKWRNLELEPVQKLASRDELQSVVDIFGRKQPRRRCCTSQCMFLKLPTSDGAD